MTRISRLRFTEGDYTIPRMKRPDGSHIEIGLGSISKDSMTILIAWLKDEMDDWEHCCPGCGDDISRFEPHHVHPNCHLSTAVQELEALTKELR